MKTFYTLLLAFGLCLTSHAQSNANIVNYHNASSQVQNELNNLLSGNLNKLLLQTGFPAKQLSNDNQGIKLVQVVESNSISNEILADFSGDYSKVKAVVLSNITTNSSFVSALDLTSFNALQYIVINSTETLSNTFVQNMLQNVQLPPNVTIVYKQDVLM